MTTKTETADVAVIGGGSAGLCAAISAARHGSKVILFERSQCLGGMGTRALVHTFCGLYHPDVSRPPEIANAGLPAEIERAMRERTGQTGPQKMGKAYVLLQDPDQFSKLANELTQAEKQLETRFGSSCIRIKKHDHFELTIQNETGLSKLQTNAIVDTSADAVVADSLKATRITVDPKERQRSAFIFALREVHKEAREENFRMRLALDIVRAAQAGTLPEALLGMASRPSAREGEIYFTIDLNPEDPITQIGRDLAIQLSTFLKTNYPAYKKASQPIFPECPGIRESFQWLGQYTLTEEDLLTNRSFPDQIAWATWPIELRETTRGPKLRYFHEAKPSAIPLSCLTSQEIPGVFFAGRCLSATHHALASVRVMGTCFATGQAAGLAASLHTQGITETAEQASRIRDYLI